MKPFGTRLALSPERAACSVPAVCQLHAPLPGTHELQLTSQANRMMVAPRRNLSVALESALRLDAGRRRAHALARTPSTPLPEADFTQLPTIDIGPFGRCPVEDITHSFALSPEAQAVLLQLHHACLHVGFFYLVGHGVDETVIHGVRNATRAFFALSDEHKNEVALHNSPLFRGYQRVGQNVTQGRPDWHEALDFYREFPSDHPAVLAGKQLHGPNQWPKQPAQLRPVMQQYVAAMTGLGQRVMRLIAFALTLPADAFERGRCDEPFWVVRAIGYPPLSPEAAKEGSLGCGEHTDYGLLTFVNQDPGITALQVRNRSGVWVDAPPVPGALVVNLGDMLTIWSNGIYQSTLHRVVNRSPKYRVSVPFFYEPNFDAVVAPMPECVAASGHKKLYKAVVYGDHLYKKVTTNFV